MKIVFLCHFSNPMVREKLNLKKYAFRRFIYRLKGGAAMYDDFAIWVTDYIAEFEKHGEVEFHIVAPHYGMEHEFQTFVMNGVIYHFFKSNYGIIQTVFNNTFHLEERNDYKRNREKMKKVINEISPDIVLLCGAENPYYSIGVLDVKEKPVYVILQTLLNDAQRIEMGVGSPYRRRIELEVFKHARYYSTAGEKSVKVITGVNPNAVFLPVKFPSHRPKVTIPPKKEYDFCFFARTIGKNKGIEDLLLALVILKETKNDVSLNIIGGCPADYKRVLESLIDNLGIKENVNFAGYYNQIQDTFDNVVKARATVVPGITALNSTVRESMYMKMPTICYEFPSTAKINQEMVCLFTAPVGDINGLAKQMLIVLEQPEMAAQIAENGKSYAEREYGNASIVNKLLDNCRKIMEKKV